MAATTSALPAIAFNPAINHGDLLDLEVAFRATFNFMLDADETGRNIREAGRDIIRRFLEELQLKQSKPRQALLDFIARTYELFESATGHLVQVRAASAKCLMEMWAERTGIYTPNFQRMFLNLKQLSTACPRPDLFEFHCFRALVKCPRFFLDTIFFSTANWH